MRLADKVTIITGGGGGMGRVAAQMFAREGARVVVAEYGEAAGRETVALIEAGYRSIAERRVVKLSEIEI